MAENTNGQLPNGLPDPETLTRLANEYWAEYDAVPNGIASAAPPNGVPANADAAAASAAPVWAMPEVTPDSVGSGAAPLAPEPIPTSSRPSAGGVPPVPMPAGTPTAVPRGGFDELPSALVPILADPFSLLPMAMTAMTPASVPWNGVTVTEISDPAFYFVAPAQAAGAPSAGMSPESTPPLDPKVVRGDFPILSERVNGRQLVWFDNAATTQKPQEVIDRLAHFYAHENSNIHRGAHELAARATDAFESARDTVARFLGAGSSDDIVFVRGTTEAINLVAQSWGGGNVAPGDEIVITHLEHHSNIVPWQQLAAEKGAVLRVAPVDDSGQILLDEYGKLLGDHTRLVAVSHVSNALGTITPVREMTEMAHSVGALTLVDGAQAVAHMPVDVSELDADFYVFSGHKIFAPTGIGVLYGKPAVLESMPPWQGGGNMITDVTLERSEYQHPPARFEAGTSSIADAVGLGTALDYVQRIGLPRIAAYEHELLGYATESMQAVPGLHLIGTAPDKASVLSFTLDGYSPAKVGSELNKEGIAVRSGHHCAQPILRRYGLEETVRPSLAFYNTYEEVDLLVSTLRRLAAYAGRQ
jgi:cysteine desulfurase/selenocysteine lyase